MICQGLMWKGFIKNKFFEDGNGEYEEILKILIKIVEMG